MPTGLSLWGNFQLKRILKGLERVEKGHAAGDDRAALVLSLVLTGVSLVALAGISRLGRKP